ncbi:SDR family NAD(P)-dependent oxidoreductase [Colwellia sp. Bg11-12]|jgi:short-subunit dehydrogenase|uniref:SDR family NAD(P)-dependent oxidoreductase n=1 Tax=Colwellia sp. Bg11-12 TaxID=2759817 RepID=UPI0015F43ED2|nr:SDR family oxidoreductase [Colwellia sp. Bg11-12]MBA6264788.1 SDR family oxidoreductase [Colwellia sp. Bg11-12]
MNIAIFGASSKLSIELIKQLSEFKITTFGRTSTNIYFNAEDLSSSSIATLNKVNYDTYIFNLGFIQSKRLLDQEDKDIYKSLCINALFVIKSCEYILSNNSKARIFIIGSESGKKGSFDTSYFLAKSMLRAYTKERQLISPEQQLLLISPSTISDGKMTTDRADVDTIARYKKQHPKKRFLESIEVASFVADIIKNPSTYLCNTEIELNGGKFSRMTY